MSEGEIPSTVRKGKEAKTRSMRKARGSERMARVAAGTWGQAGGDTRSPWPRRVLSAPHHTSQGAAWLPSETPLLPSPEPNTRDERQLMLEYW